MPQATVDQLYGHLVKAIQHPDTKELFAKGGAEASGIPPAEMVREVKRLDERWGAVIREVGVKLD
jgi:tripartite-type tricarboxylate transporter receptor subunit TctC